MASSRSRRPRGSRRSGGRLARKLTVAYSSDSDDAFMVHGLKHGDVPSSGYAFSFYGEDIEQLNEKAFLQTYDVTALSAAVYPLVQEEYALLACGGSFGSREWGPAVVVSEDSPVQTVQELAGKRVVFPGVYTSAYATSVMLFAGFVPRFVPFTCVIDEVLSGRCEAGVLIHEAQMRPPDGLRVVSHLGELWHQKTLHLDLNLDEDCYSRGGCPLPLGVIAIRRGLPERVQGDMAQMYSASVEYGLYEKRKIIDDLAASIGSTYLVQLAMSRDMLEQYIDRYVGWGGDEMTFEQRLGLREWFDYGRQCHLWGPINMPNPFVSMPVSSVINSNSKHKQK